MARVFRLRDGILVGAASDADNANVLRDGGVGGEAVRDRGMGGLDGRTAVDGGEANLNEVSRDRGGCKLVYLWTGPYTGFNDGGGQGPVFDDGGGAKAPNLKISPKS